VYCVFATQQLEEGEEGIEEAAHARPATIEARCEEGAKDAREPFACQREGKGE